MFVSRVSAARLSSQRLDADFYRPEFLKNEEKLLTKKVGRLGDVGHFFAGPFGSLLPRNLYLDKGIPLFRVGNVGQFEVLTDNFAHLAPHVHDELKTSEVRPGDLLVVKASVGEKICKVPDWIPKANITQHIIGIRPNGTFDTDYVSAFLFSSFGVLQLQRYSLGSIIQYLGITDAKGTYIVKADPVAQKYIGDKVRQAERLRDWAEKRYKESVDLFEGAVVTFGYQQKASKNFVWAKLDNRFDPAYYNPKYSFLGEAWFLTNSQPLREFIGDGAYGVLPDSNSYGSGNERFIRATDIRQSNIDPTAFTLVPSDQVAPKAKIRAGDVLLEIKGAIEACELAGAHLHGAYVNGSIYRFTPKNIKSGYLAFYLRSFIKQLYCERVSVNNIIAYLDLGSISALPVLRLSAEQEENIEQAFLSHLESARYGFALTKAAKMLVEALIEGQLTETELIAAEQALQAGNDQLDRRVLNRLKTDGVDGQGPALFGDLDALYHLLAQAEGD